MKLLLAAAVFVLVSSARANPYARPIDFNNIQQSASIEVDPNGVAPTVAMTDIALLTHDTADGTIIPAAWRGVVPPEDWAPLEIGFGGSAHVTGGKLAGNAVIHLGTSVNVAPQLGAALFAKVDASSPSWLQATKAMFLNTGGQGFRIGGGFSCTAINGGIFQSGKESCPGRGPLDIAKKAARVEGGFGWKWGKKP